MTNLFPDKNEIVTLKNDYKILLKTLFSAINVIEEQNINDNRWFVFSEKVARKFSNQAHTIDFLFSNGIFINGERVIDFSSLFSLLRNQFENYAVFYHLFVDRECEMEENILRFKLWELDAIKTRQKYKKDAEVEELLKLENDMIDCIEIIKKIPYFKNLSLKNQNFLINHACWKFTSESLRNTNNFNKKISIDKMIMNTKIKEATFQNWYAYSSTHIHTSYWSVVQNCSLDENEQSVAEYLAVTQANLLTAFFIYDLYKIYKVGDEGYDGLSKIQQDVIKDYSVQFRKKQS